MHETSSKDVDSKPSLVKDTRGISKALEVSARDQFGEPWT